MALEIWTPLEERPRYVCHICGSMMLHPRSYEAHVTKCVKENEGAIERWRSLKRDNVLFEQGDPEYRDWQAETGKLE